MTSRPANERVLAAASLLRARGPDANGSHRSPSGRAVFAHRRLSIIDLDSRSNQPFSTPDGRYTMVFNGEIYNFEELKVELSAAGQAFRTSSDTEVLLYALAHWGVDALKRLNGMFAFALWDETSHRLLMARDRLGVKPLYLDASISGRLAFASTLGPLLALRDTKATLNISGLGAYLQTLYIPAGQSAVNEIQQLRAGCYLTADALGVTTREWWTPADAPRPQISRDMTTALDELDTRISSAVGRRLISDVPVGVFLSGGVDSSLITAYMTRRAQKQVQTFTIGFNETAHDESAIARAVSLHLGTNHHEFVAQPGDLIGLAEHFTDYFDEPFADVSAIPSLLVSKLTRRHVTVALCGDGGDECFGGYNYYAWVARYASLRHAPASLRRKLAGLADRLPHRAAMALAALRFEDTPSTFAFMRSASKFARWDRLLKSSPFDVAAHFSEVSRWRAAGDPRLQAMAADLGSYLVDDILVKGDRSTMAFSVEGRHPLLDVNVVEYALGLPAEMLFKEGQTKWPLRQLLSRYVPASISSRPKHGFTVPIREWFRGPLRAFLHDSLSASESAHDPVLNQLELQVILQEHDSGRANHENLLWAALVYRLWLAKYMTHLRLP